MTQPGTKSQMSRPLTPETDHFDPEVSVREIVRVLIEHRRVIVSLAAIAPVVAAVIVLLTPRTFTSTASFYPESRRSAGGLSSIAQQYGLNLGGMGGDAAQSLPFYVELVKSREILARLATDTLPVRTGDRVTGRTVPELLEVDTPPSELVEETVAALRRAIRPSANPTTGIVRIDVVTRSAEASQALAQRTIDLINEFNLRQRQSQGANERKFAERRLAEMTDSLRVAEERLREFEDRNKQYEFSPNLRLEHRRLTNNLTAKQMLHNAMAQSHEQARIEEIRDTPVITVLERPVVPARGDSRGGLRKMLFAFVLALLAGSAYAFIRSTFGFWKFRS